MGLKQQHPAPKTPETSDAIGAISALRIRFGNSSSKLSAVSELNSPLMGESILDSLAVSPPNMIDLLSDAATPQRRTYLTSMVEDAIKTPLNMLLRREGYVPDSASSSRSDMGGSSVSLDEVLKLKGKVDALSKHRQHTLPSVAFAQPIALLSPSPFGGSPPQDAVNAAAEKALLAAYAEYSDRLFALFCSQTSHVEAMKVGSGFHY